MVDSVLWAVIFAFLGGMILNIMPCVFPILSLKVLALTKHQQQGQFNADHHIAYAGGILFSFAVLAIAVILLKISGESIGWGFQMQSPVFVSILIYLLFLVGLNLFGFFEFHLPISFGQSSEHSTLKSFGTGILMTCVATPCTAPFMAPAIGFALTQSYFLIIGIFLALGLGLAFPFLILAQAPKLLAWLPKPGAWMLTFKQFLAFPMFLSVAWLVWVLSAQASRFDVLMVLCGLIGLTFAIWLYQIWNSKSVIKFTCITIMTVISLTPIWTSQSTSPTQKFNVTQASFDDIDKLLANQQKLFVNVTADWCITCKINEQTTLSSDETKAFFVNNQITVIHLDWTNQDNQITAYLEKFQRPGVPLYVYYNSQGQPIILPQLLTKEILKKAINAHSL